MTCRVERIDPDSAPAREIASHLADHNQQRVGERDLQPLCLALRDQHNQLIGGLLGETIWGWLLVQRIWLDQAWRRQGLGWRLLQQAEQEAMARGCHHASLETHSFQALPFYTRHGYQVYGQLDDFPLGQTRYSLRKKLLADHGEDAVGRATEAIQSYRPTTSDTPKNPNPADPPHTAAAPETAYFAMLHQVTLDILNRRGFDELIQTVVDSAATMLDSPLVELMLLEGDELATVAYTQNQAHLKGDRVKRGQSLISWRALDSGVPAMMDDYSQWAGKRAVYDVNLPHAIADFPVRIGDKSIGVLALGRTRANHPYQAAELDLGIHFAEVVALVMDSARREREMLQQLELRKAAEARLLEQNAELDAYSRTVAHDLKTPLTTLVGMARILQMPTLPDAARHNATEAIYRTALKMNQIVQALLSLGQSRLEQPVQMEPCQPGPLVHEAVARLQQQISNSAAQVRVAPDIPHVQGHAPWLEEVFANLISNALKYGGTPPLVEVGGMAVGDKIKLWVRDHGPGIAPEQQNRLFREFSRLGNETTQVEGHGLGLSIVKRLIEAMDGHIGLEHPAGGGACFYFLLPMRKNSAAAG
jgi:signal transduction histidine kinase/GNAT superfamily N-acetyltransferase